jgi:hypothetical protein
MNRWYFWVLAPVAIGSAIIIPLVAEPRAPWGHTLVWVIVGTLLLGTLGLANSSRFRWALRSVALVIVCAGVAYFVSELIAWSNGRPMGAFGRRSDSSLWNAGLFLMVFGLPALRYLRSRRSGSVIDVIASPEAINEANPAPRDGVPQSGCESAKRSSRSERRSNLPLQPAGVRS